MNSETLDVISLEETKSLPGLFQERVKRTPTSPAYRYYDSRQSNWRTISWSESNKQILSIQAALAKENLQHGDRVAVMLRNCPQWVFFEQAALRMGLVVVPLYTNDRADNVSYVLQDAGVKLLLIENESALKQLEPIASQLQGLLRLISVETCDVTPLFPRLVALSDWQQIDNEASQLPEIDIDALATLVYTSGTTGRPKGVMLSHRNILFNASAAVKLFPISHKDVFLSFLPLSHMLERTLGLYIPIMCGSTVAYARSVDNLVEDLLSQRPTILISVPRIYERVYNKIKLQVDQKSPFAQKLFHSAVDTGWQRFLQGGKGGGLRWPILKILVANKIMAKLGGRLRLAICGGAPLSADVAKVFIGLGLNLIQGYGLTETSPIISGNPADRNEPSSVGIPLPGVEVSIGENDELLARSPSTMLGYWNNDEATSAMIDENGWLHTGDLARIEDEHIYITGRLKDILVLSNGEKVPPADIELAISLNPLFEQVLIIGENKPFLSVFITLEHDAWITEAKSQGFDINDPEYLKSKPVQQFVLDQIAENLKGFPGYTTVRAVTLLNELWTIEDGSMTPTMKLRRAVIIERNQSNIYEMYAGH
jgi:long-chain acyl-CoA synthetase